MDVVILGARERVSVQDSEQVIHLLRKLNTKYGQNMIVYSAACDRGIGSFVKDYCVKSKDERNHHEFKFIEVAMHVFAELSRPQMNRIYEARNGALRTIGDEFHVFLNAEKRGVLHNFVASVAELERPVFVYEPGAVPKRLTGLVNTETGQFDYVEIVD